MWLAAAFLSFEVNVMSCVGVFKHESHAKGLFFSDILESFFKIIIIKKTSNFLFNWKTVQSFIFVDLFSVLKSCVIFHYIESAGVVWFQKRCIQLLQKREAAWVLGHLPPARSCILVKKWSSLPEPWVLLCKLHQYTLFCQCCSDFILGLS